MKYLRLAAICVFVLCAGLACFADYDYTYKRDTTPPALTSDTDYLEISVSGGQAALMEGLHAYDDTDGDITDRIMVASTTHFTELGEYKVRYVVFDSCNNSATLTRTVHYVDYTSPRFSLEAPLVYTKGSEIRYLDYVTVNDVIDGDITDRIKVKSSNVSSYTPASYPVVLEVSNSCGDTVQVELNVVVEEADENTVDIRLKEYLVYITQGDFFAPNAWIQSVSDENGASLSKADVTVTGSINTKQPGNYQLVYSYSDGSNQGRAYLTVVVLEDVS